MTAGRWVWAGAIVVAIAVAPDAGAAARKPDLAVAKLSAPPASVAAGGAFTVTAKVRNAGTKRAGASKLAALLSKDARRSKDDLKLGGSRKVAAVKPRKTGTAKLKVTVPASAPAGAYRMIVCADAAGQVKERSEKNNCRATTRAVTVTRTTAAPGGGNPAATNPPSSNPTPAPTPTATPDPGSPANPLDVGDETLDTAHAVTRRTAGANNFPLTTTAADGTKYSLILPSGSLASAEDITMTPVTSVAGLPFAGGLIGAVHLEPAGLQLLKPATLTIEPPAGAPAGEQTAFQFQQGGDDFHLYPLEGASKLTLGLTHFSTPGVARATDLERAQVQLHTPERQGARLEQDIAEIARQERLNEMDGHPDPTFGEKIGQVLASHYDTVVKPALTTASTSDGNDAEQAIVAALAWARQAEILGASSPAYTTRRDEMWQLIEIVIRNAVDKGYHACVSDHDLTQIIRLLEFQRFALLLGLDIGDAWDKALACGHFALDFDATFTDDEHSLNGGGGPYDLSATWRMLTDHLPINVYGTGSGPLTWGQFSYHSTSVFPGGSCTLTTTVDGTTRKDITADVSLELDLTPRETPPAGQPVPAPRAGYLKVTPKVDFTMESYHSQNSGCSTDASDYTDFRWYSMLNDFHTDPGESPGARIKLDPGHQQGDLLEAAHIARSHDIGSDHQAESTYIELFHTPQPVP